MGKCRRLLNNSNLKEALLPITILGGAVIGVVVGFGLRQCDPSLNKLQSSLLMFPGQLMIQMMKMLMIPITVSSIIVSMAKMDLKTTGKIGIKAMVFYISTLIIASLVGILLASTIKPAPIEIIENSDNNTVQSNVRAGVSLIDLIRNFFPDNLIKATFKKKSSTFIKTKSLIPNSTFKQEDDIRVDDVSGTNLLGLIVFAITFGLAIGSLKERGEALLKLFESLYDVSIRLILIYMWYIPIGVLFLIASNLVRMENPYLLFQNLGLLFGLTIFGLFLHGFIVLPVIYLIFVRRNPFKFIYTIFPAISTAFATESSAATIPISMKCLEKAKIDNRIVRMIVPIGATINMDGTCLYLNIVGNFIAYLHGVEVNAGMIFTTMFLSISMAMGAAAIPGGGGGNYEIAVLTANGLPISDVYMIYMLSWFLARCRTSVNIMGDAFGCGIVAKLSMRDLDHCAKTPDDEGGHLMMPLNCDVDAVDVV